MTRHQGRAARRGATTLASVAALLCTAALTAGPALAVTNENLGPREGADTDSGMSLGATLLIFVVLPAVILLGVAALVWLPGMVKADRYRPQRGWAAPPIWFAGPPDPVAAVETADTGSAVRGGASGAW